MKLVSFIFLLTIILLEVKLCLWEDLAFFQKVILNYLFPKDLNIVRVRKLEEVKTVFQNNIMILDFIGLVERYGYLAEEHYVTTEDGYNLVIHRMSGNPISKSQNTRKVVFLKNGLFGSSDMWVFSDKSLAFLLADEGYDVWLGNSRGNTYCRSHVKLSPRNKDFWKFSYHEIGTRDLPAMIDYVLNYTNQKTLHYIGLSMANTELFALLSIRPEYNAKIKLGICFAPIAIWKEIPLLLEYIFYWNNMILNFKKVLDSNEIYEIASLSSTTIMVGRTLCADKTIIQDVCTVILSLIGGFSLAQLNTTMLSEILPIFPAGSSVQSLHHFYQNMIAKKFQAYDYGYFDNYKQYRQITPIIYDLNKITAPLTIYYGANDLLATKANVLEICKHLPNVILLEENKLFNHFDYILAVDVKTMVYDHVMELLQEFNNKI
ncbi:gastric triacylglycerol lipase-like [Mycetomoellerius zeteki]|uniref:gastric triacylglycerol lipase-like n=1 Tax=Mycetomoellerius zeteki TaxID=64791 RepID=UPI00084E5C41|nr:PREDICTED: gastric triacylglycerol lipase-like [Trachymyrmex zeteki]